MSEFHLWSRSISVLAAALAGSATALAQPLAVTEPSGFPQTLFERVIVDPRAPQTEFDRTIGREPRAATPAHLRRQIVAYPSRDAPGTIVIDTPNTYLYYVLGDGRAMRYGIGVGREGFSWSGTQSISRKKEWPDWHPPAEMVARQPYLPRFMSGGPGNPLGARALYLGNTLYRIHGTNEPHTIGQRVSSGCIRMLNEDVIDLFNRVSIGARVVVLPDTRRAAPRNVARSPAQREPVQRGAVQSQPAQHRASSIQRAEPPGPATPHFARSTLQYGSSASRLY
jgi:lipoprotein-anchoring transpeptidase ErfK/SrfK